MVEIKLKTHSPKGRRLTYSGHYEQGYAAYLNGEYKNDCPYEWHEPAADWLEGWDDAYNGN